MRAAIEAWARARKAEGDPRTLDQLRWAALVAWSKRYLSGGQDAGQDASQQGPPGAPGSGGPPSQHGSPIVINIGTDLTTFLGLTAHPLEILGTGVLIPATALNDLIPDAGLRRLITDPMTGHLLDASPRVYRPSASLARFVELRDGISTAPGSTVPAGWSEIDHTQPFDSGGTTTRDNLSAVNKHWHRAKTLGGWTVVQNLDRTWTWTSPCGLTATTEPHDFRLGP